MTESGMGMGHGMGAGEADVTVPLMISATIAADGDTLTLVFNEAVQQGGSYADAHIDVDASTAGNNVGVTYVSGDGTITHIYPLDSTIVAAETVNLDFDGTGNSLEDLSGNDLAAIVSKTVVNNSTQS